MIMELGPYRLDVDTERTDLFYRNMKYDGCGCRTCRNFAQGVLTLPAAADLFAAMGIDIRKPAEVFGSPVRQGNYVRYGGFYHICGRILEGRNPWVQTDESTYHLDEQYSVKITDDFSVYFEERCVLLEDGFPEPCFQMNITADVPWVLPERIDL